MAENVLKARITADVSGLKSGLAQAERALDVYSQKIERVQEGIKRSDQQTKLFEVELNKLTSALKSGAINQDEFNKSSDVVKDNISKSRQETAAWQRELSRLEKALQDVKSTEDQVSVSTANVGQEIKNISAGNEVC
jgi:chromosome segregation ATPase